jgi:crotonobetainyl-CoA hydratase
MSKALQEMEVVFWSGVSDDPAARETAHLAIQDASDLVKSKRVATVRTLYESEDAKEGARAFAEKGDPVWRGR